MSKYVKGALAVLALGSVAGAEPIVVGSKLDREGQLLGQMIILTLRNAGYQVTDKTNFGDTGANRKAILAATIDVYPEYTGNAAFMFPAAKVTPQEAGSAEAIYRVAETSDVKNGLTWLAPANVNNTWIIAVPEAFAKSQKISSVADLATYVNNGGKFKIAGSPEFFRRPDTMPAFESTYKFRLSDDQKLIIKDATPPQTEQAAAKGTNGVTAAMGYGTDGSLSYLKLVALKDPLGAQPVYQPSPVIRTAILKNNPQIKGLLEGVFATLDQTTMQKLNAQVGLEGKSIVNTARDYLKGKGLIK